MRVLFYTAIAIAALIASDTQAVTLVSQPQSSAMTGAYGQMEALISSMSKLNASNAESEAAAEAAAASTPPTNPVPA